MGTAKDKLTSQVAAPGGVLPGHRWQDGKGTATIDVAGEAGEELRQEVLGAFRSLPKRGVEVGGLLLGRVESETPLRLAIDSFAPLECEHRFGPSFHLSDPDLERLEQTLEELERQNLRVVGYYRSCAGRDLEFDDADRRLIDAYLGDTAYVAMLIQPASLRTCKAVFFLRRDGGIEAEPEGPRLTLAPPAAHPAPAPPMARAAAASPGASAANETWPLIGRPERGSPSGIGPRPDAAPPTAAEAAMPPVETGLEEPESTPFARGVPWLDEEPAAGRRLAWPWVTLAAVAVLAAVWFWGPAAAGWWSSGERSGWADLGLDARRTGEGIEVRWDRSAPEAQAARRGVLSIADGESSQDIELNAAAIGQGRYTYQPSSGDVRIRLEMFGEGGRTHAEILRLLDPVASPASRGAAAPAAAPPVDLPESEPAPSRAAQDADPPVAASDRQTAAVTREPRETQPRSSPPGPGPRERAATAAEALDKVQPGIPEGIRARITRHIRIPVVVSIDASGRVRGATAEAGGDSVYRYLAERARSAALSWRFRPARTDSGAPVPSSQTVYFLFDP